MRSTLGVVLALFTAPLVHALEFVESEINGSNGVVGLVGPRSVAVSPGGNNVYAACSSDGGDHALVTFMRNHTNGSLTFAASISNGQDITSLKGVQSVAVSPDGKNVYTSAFADGLEQVTTFTRGLPDGDLTWFETLIDEPTHPIGNAQIVISPDGKHVYIADRLGSSIIRFLRDPLTGGLSLLGATEDESNLLKLLQGLAFDHQGRHLYAVAGDQRPAESTSGNGIVVFSRNEQDGSLTRVEALKDGGTDRTGNTIDGLEQATSVAVSPDSKHVYVACKGGASTPDWLAVFSRHAITGQLTFLQSLHEPTYPDLAGPQSCNGINGPSSIVVNPLGGEVYATYRSNSALVQFTRQASNGQLVFKRARCGANNGFGLSGILDAAVSPDGKHIYTASTEDNTLSVFSAAPRPILPVLKIGFKGGQFEITVGGLTPGRTYLVKRGFDLESFPIQAGFPVVATAETHTFVDLVPFGTEGYYFVEEVP